MKRPNAIMVEHLNLKLKDEGSCLRYIEARREGEMTTYELRVVDKYIDAKVSCHINITLAFDTMVREFFKQYGAEDIGYANTIATIFTFN